MKEVTRIRIAKLSYDIELAAKKHLEQYLEDLSTYVEDDNVLEDIEIRMTELLDARGVKAGGVVTHQDVKSLREQLGEPGDFSIEGDVVNPTGELHQKRKLYRDIDHAVLGGVLGGVAQFFRLNVLWVRLAFILLLLVSFGFIAALYLILWIGIPAAKSVTEKLQMRGEAATLGNIRKYKESQEGVASTRKWLRLRRKGVGIAFGVVGILIAVVALGATVFGAIAWVLLAQEDWLVFGLGIAGGVLVVVFGVLVAHSGFVARVTKSHAIAASAVIIAGVLALSGAVALAAYRSWQQEQAIRQSVKETSVTLPENFAAVKSLTIDVEEAIVAYQVSEDTRATLTALPGVRAVVKQDGSTATVSMEVARHNDPRYTPALTIYGPRLDSLELKEGQGYYTAKVQDLTVTISRGRSLTLAGNYTQLNADLKDMATLETQEASVKNVIVSMESRSSAVFGNVNSLNVTQPTACPNNALARLWVESVSDGKLTYNGALIVQKSYDASCGSVSVGTREGEYDESYN